MRLAHAMQSRSIAPVAFRRDLVADLCAAQMRLGDRFRSIVTHYLNGSRGACLDAVERFDNELRAYQVRVCLELDPYLRCLLGHEPMALMLIDTVSERLRAVGRRVHAIAEGYRDANLDADEYQRFGEELALTDGAVAWCLAAQREHLFPRYRLFHGRVR